MYFFIKLKKTLCRHEKSFPHWASPCYSPLCDDSAVGQTWRNHVACLLAAINCYLLIKWQVVLWMQRLCAWWIRCTASIKQAPSCMTYLQFASPTADGTIGPGRNGQERGLDEILLESANNSSSSERARTTEPHWVVFAHRTLLGTRRTDRGLAFSVWNKPQARREEDLKIWHVVDCKHSTGSGEFLKVVLDSCTALFEDHTVGHSSPLLCPLVKPKLTRLSWKEKGFVWCFWRIRLCNHFKYTQTIGRPTPESSQGITVVCESLSLLRLLRAENQVPTNLLYLDFGPEWSCTLTGAAPTKSVETNVWAAEGETENPVIMPLAQIAEPWPTMELVQLETEVMRGEIWAIHESLHQFSFRSGLVQV